MKNQLFNKRIPTVLGLGFVVLGIILTTIIIRNQTSLKSKASNSEIPQNVKITNLSNNSFTITYETEAAATGSVNYGRDKKLGNTELDERDLEKGDFSPKNIHSITVKKLSPNTKYYLVVVSGQNTFLNNDSPFEISTAPNISSPSAQQITVQGKVVLPNGNAPDDAFVYLSAEGSQLLSTGVAKDGRFNFSLKYLRTSDFSSYLKLNENSVLKLLVINNSLKSNVLVSMNQADSIPMITLSNDYDFTNKSLRVASKSAESKPIGFPAITNQSSNVKPQILTPKKNQSFTDQKPQFRGTSLPNETVEIIIHSDENIQTQVTADSSGNWSYRPPNNLSEGNHTITIKTRDASGILTTIMQSFTVFAAEITQAPTLTSTPMPFPSPTAIVLPLILTPTPLPILEPSPTFTPIESKGGLPPTGSSSILIAIGGIAATITGIVLFLLTRTVL